MTKLGYLLAGCTLAALLTASAASAQSHPEFIPLGRVSAALYKPDSGPAPHIAFLVAHRSGNNLNNIACRELSKRGFAVLCFNTRYINNDTIAEAETVALDVKTAVDYARTIPGVTKVNNELVWIEGVDREQRLYITTHITPSGCRVIVSADRIELLNEWTQEPVEVVH